MMLNVEDYLLQYKRRKPNLLLLWLKILAFIIVFIGIINQTFQLNEYYQLNGVIKNGYLCILVPCDEIKKIVSNHELYIDEHKYTYKVTKISDSPVQDITGVYQEMFLSVVLEDKDFIDNRIVKVKFIVKERTILEYIFKLLKGEN